VILVDTSAWIEFDRATGSPTHQALAAAIGSDPASVAVTEPVLMEVLAGARSDADARRLRNMLTSVAWLPCDPAADFEGAARIYRHCRLNGVTPRSVNDCLIASIALRTDAALLTADRDFDALTRCVPLRLA
jgi:predicted nucleic acid-binding protein